MQKIVNVTEVEGEGLLGMLGEHVYNLVPPVNVGFMDTEEAVNYQAIRSFKAGAECALREAIDIINETVKSDGKVLIIGALIVRDRLKQLLSDANKDV